MTPLVNEATREVWLLKGVTLELPRSELPADRGEAKVAAIDEARRRGRALYLDGEAGASYEAHFRDGAVVVVTKEARYVARPGDERPEPGDGGYEMVELLERIKPRRVADRVEREATVRELRKARSRAGVSFPRGATKAEMIDVLVNEAPAEAVEAAGL